MSYLESQPPLPPGPKPQTILTVENDSDLREQLKTTLQFGGYTCVEAEDGLEALSVLRRRPMIDLIISDFQMPKMDGLQLLRTIKQAPKTKAIPFLLSTGNSSFSLRKQAMQDGAFAILYKPYTPHELFHILNRVIFLQMKISVLSGSSS